jgi:hypothetical protein
MKYIYPVLFFSLLGASCGIRMNYLGSTSAPTETVDVYVDVSAIKRPYTIIGKGYPEYAGYAQLFYSTDKLQQKAVEVARKKGAHAILFQEMLLNGTTVDLASKTDYSQEREVTTTSGAISPMTTRERVVFFLRYD